MSMAVMQSWVWASSDRIIQAMIKTNPLSDRGWMSLAVSELRKGDWKACQDALDKAHTLNPRNPALYYNLGCLYFQKQEWRIRHAAPLKKL